MISSGCPGFDGIIGSLQKGDNVVWQVDALPDYEHFAGPFVANALKEGRKVVYVRFADHAPLVRETAAVVQYQLDPDAGFEPFSAQVHSLITTEGRDTYYVFDCLSHLLTTWATDLMIGNFFKITCPYLYRLDTIAYFAVIRGHHSFKTIARIRETTQLLIDVYRVNDNLYVHPTKVFNRYSPTMFMPHRESGNGFRPITDSVNSSLFFRAVTNSSTESPRRNLDYWDLLFLQAEEAAAVGGGPGGGPEYEGLFNRLGRVMLTRDEKMMGLARRFFSLEDLVKIKTRLIGTGLIGGKALGMLLARRILTRDTAMDWSGFLEPHDSFFIGSDVYYTYIVQNGDWELYLRQKSRAGFYSAAAELRERLLQGSLPEEIEDKIQQTIDYFGQAPIILRSSSLLEDSYGNAFAGKYESIFLVNQGSPEERCRSFGAALKRIYASTMNEDALAYRAQRHLDEAEEQMSLLVQRVSGAVRGRYFFPFCGGVGVSYNTYIWKERMDPQAGMLRLVFGLGTRAVDRVEGDFPRIVALDDPSAKPHAGWDDARRFSQHQVDVLNLETNSLETVALGDLAAQCPGLSLDLIAVRDHEVSRWLRESGQANQEAWLLTFDRLLSQTDFTARISQLLKILEQAYSYPVDIEFTLNVAAAGQVQLSLLQCRPLQIRGMAADVPLPEAVAPEQILFSVQGNFVGGNIMQRIDCVIMIAAREYLELASQDKYEVARLVGRLNRELLGKDDLPGMLLGPGRWGASLPAMGVPINFAEINHAVVLGELSFPDGDLMPEPSYGTHFFHDLVETGIFYVAIFPTRDDVKVNWELLQACPLLTQEWLAPKYAAVIKVYHTAPIGLSIMANVVTQRVLCFSWNER